MYIPRLRRISDVIKEVKAADPNTKLTYASLEDLAREGFITSMKFGNAWLINIDELAMLFKSKADGK